MTSVATSCASNVARAHRAVDPLFSSYASKIVAGYEADIGVTQAAGLVSQWNDRTANANHVVQGTDANKWAYNASGGPGGLPYLTSFPNASGFKVLIKTSAAGFAAGDFISWAVVWKLNCVGASELPFNHKRDAATAKDNYWYFHVANTRFLAGFENVTGALASDGTVTFGAWKSGVMNWNTVTGNADWYESRAFKGTSASIADTTGMTAAADTIRIGRPADDAARPNFDLAAHYIFNQPLSTEAERAQWFDWALDKYGV